jgi:glutaredoxin 3
VTVDRPLDDPGRAPTDADPPVPDGPEGVLVYTLIGCLHCSNARRRLKRNGIAFAEQPVELLEHGRRTLMQRTGGSTAPQIVIGQRAIGGADALARLDRSGALDGLIGGKRFPRAVVRRRLTAGCVLRWLLTTPFGGACGIRTITVDMVDEHGRRLERRPAPTPDAAELLADALNAGIDSGAGVPGPGG